MKFFAKKEKEGDLHYSSAARLITETSEIYGKSTGTS